MNVQLDIPVGEWRDLTVEELKTINSMISDSQKTVNSAEIQNILPDQVV